MGFLQVSDSRVMSLGFYPRLLYAELPPPLHIVVDFGAVVASVSGTDVLVVLVTGEGPEVVPSAPIPLLLA